MDNRLREYRVKAGLTQVELARRARMADSNLNAIERGRLLAWPKARRSLARVLRVQANELFPSENLNG